MSKQPPRRNAPKRRPQARKGRTVAAARTAGKRSDRTGWIIAAVVVAIGVALVFVFASSSKNKPDATTGFFKGVKSAPASLVAKVTSVPTKTIDAVGQGSLAGGLPKKLPAGPPLKTSAGLPRVVYMGAEYCPFCATERWSMLQALARFGTFKNLKITRSAVTNPQGQGETDPATATFSFRGATYTSKYVSFESVEEEDNSYQPLETPTAEQSGLETKYDVAPYTSQAGSIPFIDFANQYVIIGATYDASVLQGKDHNQIAAALQDPSTDIAKGSVGSANVIAATICKITGNQPANVCNDSAVKKIVGQLG